MNKKELIKQISATIGKRKVLELSKILKEQQLALPDLVAITFHTDEGIAFRAAWILENIFLQNPETYLPHLEHMLLKFPDVKYASCQRHYAKIIMHITSLKSPQSIKNKIAAIDLEPPIEKLFDWMIDTKVKIAVKVFAAEALFNMRHRYNWIQEELANQIHYLMRNGTAAIQSRGKKLLSKM